MNTIQEKDHYLIPAYGRYPISFVRGDGVRLYDTEGKEYLDFFSGIGVNALGYGHPAYTQALKDQMDRLMHISNYFYTPGLLEAAEHVVKATKLNKVFFANSGTEATEGAMKLARKYWFNKTGHSDSEIISFHHSFHGRSTGALKLTGNPHYQEAFGPLIDNVKYATLNDIDSVKALVTDHTAAVIVEPVQGEGGVNPCDKQFLKDLRALCDANDICLIFDEVQCGMGRTGTIMTYFQYDVMPDVVCLAKILGAGIPVGAFVANEKYGSAFAPGDHGSTYGGNPLAMAAVNAVFEVYEKEHIVGHAAEMGRYLEEKLDEVVAEKAIAESHRGLGLMQGLVLSEPAGPYVKKLLDKGLIVVTAGERVLRMLPPLVIETSDIDEAIAKIKSVL